MLQISSTQAAELIVRILAQSALSPVAQAAADHEPQIRRTFLDAVKQAQGVVPMDELEQFIALGHSGTGGPLYIMEDALKELERALLGNVEPAPVNWLNLRSAAGAKDLPSAFNAALVSGAGAAEVCVVSGDLLTVKEAEKIALQSRIDEIDKLIDLLPESRQAEIDALLTEMRSKATDVRNIEKQIVRLREEARAVAPSASVPKLPKTSAFADLERLPVGAQMGKTETLKAIKSAVVKVHGGEADFSYVLNSPIAKGKMPGLFTDQRVAHLSTKETKNFIRLLNGTVDDESVRALHIVVHESGHGMSPYFKLSATSANRVTATGTYFEEGLNELFSRRITEQITGQLSTSVAYQTFVEDFAWLEARVGEKALLGVWAESTEAGRIGAVDKLIAKLPGAKGMTWQNLKDKSLMRVVK